MSKVYCLIFSHTDVMKEKQLFEERRGIALQCRIGDLRDKEVINVKDGARVGFIGDVEIDTRSAALTAVVVYGRLRLFGLLGREADFVIPWRDIALIGDDTVLVNYDPPEKEKKQSAFAKFLDKLSF